MPQDDAALRRVLSLPLLTLYGIGTIVGAGFYALLGEVAGRAGTAAPTSIAIAALVASFTALSFADLATRYPESGGPVRYVQAAFGRPALGRWVGVLVIFTGVVSAATLSRAVGRFLNDLYGVPEGLPIVITAVGLGAVAAWGVREAGLLAAGITILEVGVLVAIPFVRADVLPEVPARLPELVPGPHAPWPGVFYGAFLVFYAFVGFEDMVTLAEEVKDPERNLPRGILGALVGATLLYVVVAVIAVLAVDPAELAQQSAPLGALVGARGEAARQAVVWVGILAGMNGALIQLVMAARILRGMRTSRGVLAWLAAVHPRTRTPVRATVLATVLVLVLALAFPLVALASWTSGVLLVVFALVHVALIIIGAREPRTSGFRVPRWVPVVGLLLCAGFLAVEVARAIAS